MNQCNAGCRKGSTHKSELLGRRRDCPLFFFSFHPLFATEFLFISQFMLNMFSFYCLLISFLLALLPCWTAAFGRAENVEVDLIFPRNDTYATTELMPIVFAVQNPLIASGLELLLTWQIIQNTGNISIMARAIDSTFPLSSYQSAQNNDTFFETDSIFNITNIESSWVFYWSIATSNCSSVSASLSNSSINSLIDQGRKNITFTTKNGAPAPDLVGATAEGTCAADQSFTFDVIDITSILYSTSLVTYCAVLPSTSPTSTPNPCAPKIDAPAASSISSTLTEVYCIFPDSRTLLSCPPAPTKTGGGMGRHFPSGGTVWFTAYFGWLMYSIVV